MKRLSGPTAKTDKDTRMKQIKFEVLTKIVPKDVSSMDQGDFLEFIPAEEECATVSETLYFRICSFDATKKHTEFESLKGRKLKITVETID
jgi:hypothetical protein